MQRRMRTILRATLVALAAASLRSVEATAATASLFSISNATQGSCMLRGIDTSTPNFQYMASVSAKDAAINDACGRCIRVSKDGVATPVVAYVLDVCEGCPSGQLRLSSTVLTSLSIDPNAATGVALTYKWTSCPSTMVSGSVRSCLMDGAGMWYLPLQFYNSYKVITKATIAGVDAAQRAGTFYFTATPTNGTALGDSWYRNVSVKLTSSDGEERAGSFAFPSTGGCAESSFQFSASSTGDADEAGSASSKKKTNVIIFAIVGAVCAVIVVVGAVIFIQYRRRRLMKPTDLGDPHNDGQFRSPSKKSATSGEAAFPTAHGTGSATHPGSEVSSPTAEFKDVNTPQAPMYAQAPKVTVQPTFTFSKPKEELERQASANRATFRRDGPTVPAPVLPPAMASAHSHSGSDSGSDRRSSFDIDDLRSTDAHAHTAQRSQQPPSFEEVPYSSDSAYAMTAVTSPQSYVRATTLVRPSNRGSARTLVQPQHTSSVPSVSPPPSNSAPSSSPQSYGDSSEDQRGSYGYNEQQQQFAASQGGGYRRDSLGILGYPYARKSGRGSNITEMQF